MAEIPEINIVTIPAALLETLADINGMDTYNVDVQTRGALMAAHYLQIPPVHQPPAIGVENIGTAATKTSMPNNTFAVIAYINSLVCPNPDYAATFGFLRAFAVKNGWFDRNSNYEVTRQTDLPTPVAVNEFLNSDAVGRLNMKLIDRASLMIPMFAEQVFRVRGHHFLSSDAAAFTSSYETLARASLVSEICDLMPAELLYHAALHWVSPRKAYDLVRSGRTVVPEAMKVRSNAAPAGTAIITTTAAVIDAMRSTGFYDQLHSVYAEHIDRISAMHTLIRAEPAQYHKTCTAYDFVVLAQDARAVFEKAQNSGEVFAPVAYAFIQAFTKTAALGQQKALIKRADGQPVLVRALTQWFRAYSQEMRKKPTLIEVLSNVRVTPSAVELEEE